MEVGNKPQQQWPSNSLPGWCGAEENQKTGSGLASGDEGVAMRQG